MKFICSQQDLSAACQTVLKAVSSKSTIPALEGILIKAESGKIFLTGYDLEMGISTVIDANIEEEGKIILNAKMLSEIVRRMPSEIINITADERQMCYIKSGESEFSLIGTDAEEYPSLPDVENGTEINIDTDVLIQMVKQTVYACSVDENIRPVLTGVKFEIGEGELKMIAVDGFRLAIRKEKIKYNGEKIDFVVPAKTLNEIIRIVNEKDEQISIYLGKRHIVFHVGTYKIISRLLEGEFLNYSASIKGSNTTQVIVSAASFLESIERTAVVITDRIKNPVRCIFSGDEINITCITSNVRVNDKIRASVLGDKAEISFNSRFLIDALKNTDCDEIKISLGKDKEPIRITPVDSDKFLFLIMPVRTRN